MRESAPYTIDRAHHPIIRIRWHRVVTHAEALTYFQEMDALLAEKRTVALVVTLPPGLSNNTDDQLMMSKWLRENEEALRKYVIGMCFVTSSKLLMMALRAIFIFVPSKRPWNITSSEQEGEVWCRARHREQAMTLAS